MENNNFVCPHCRRKIPFRYALSLNVSLGNMFECPYCESFIKPRKVVIPGSRAIPFGVMLGLIAIFLFRLFGDDSIITYTIYAIIIFSTTIFLAALYTYKRTEFIGV